MRIAERGLRNFGAALAEPATCRLHLRSRTGRKTLTELLVSMRPQTAVAIVPHYLERNPRNEDGKRALRGFSPIFRVSRSAIRISYSAFPRIRNSRFSFVIQAKPVEDIVLPIGGGIL
jgi:hypothetical protein